MKYHRIILVLFLCTVMYSKVLPQEIYTVGKVIDSQTKKPIKFAIIETDDSTRYTANETGIFRFITRKEKINIIISCPGYEENTYSINIPALKKEFHFELNPINTEISSSNIINKDNLIQNAIKIKIRSGNLNNDHLTISNSLTKTTASILGMSSDIESKNDYNIATLDETISENYFIKKHKRNKKEITGKRGLSPFFNRNLAEPYMNFYQDRIPIWKYEIPGPFSADAEKYYQYTYEGKLSDGEKIIYKLKLNKKTELIPLFTGSLFIDSKTLTPIRTELYLDNNTNVPLTDDIIYIQNYKNYKNESGNIITLPTDLYMYSKGSVGEIIKTKYKFFSIVKEIKLGLPENQKKILEEYDIKFKKNADLKKISWWNENSIIPLTKEEQKYLNQRTYDPERKESSISIYQHGIQFKERLGINVLTFYKYNRAEGHYLEFRPEYYSNLSRYILSGFIGYGTNDQRIKYGIDGGIEFFRERNLRFKFGFYKNLLTLFKEPNFIYIWSNTATALGIKDDRISYYYGNGYYANLATDIFRFLTYELRYREDNQNSAYITSNFSILNSGKEWKPMPKIYEGRYRILGTGIVIDLSSYNIFVHEDNEAEKVLRILAPKIIFNVDWSGKILGNNEEFIKYTTYFAGSKYLNRFINFDFKIGAILLRGGIPYQFLGYPDLRGIDYERNLAPLANNYSEFMGDEVYVINIKNNFGRIFPQSIPILRRMNLVGYFNAFKTNITERNFELSTDKNFSTTKGFFTETGFGFTRILDFFEIGFIWRLSNYKDGSNFYFHFDAGID